MSKYGYSIYGASKYGETPKLAYSVEPMDINVLQFLNARVTWQDPKGNFTKFRLVRNQNAYPETAEDGIIIFEQDSLDGNSIEGLIQRTSYYDGYENPEEIPLTPGKKIFYSVFLYTSEKIWVLAGKANEIIPDDTGVMKRMIDLLPRVLTSSDLSPLGVVDEASTLYQFLDGMAFTYEQMLVELKLLKPQHNLEYSRYKSIPAETINLGLNPEPGLPMQRQRSLIREAIPLYADKGTVLGISDYAESVTGFAPTITVSSNLMLTIQDSTFYNDTGRWEATNATITATEEMVPDNSDKSIDLTYTLKIEPSDTGTMSLGADAPITQGVPIQPDTEYYYSVKVKCPGSGGATFTVEYYDKDGSLISSTPQVLAATNSWQEMSITDTSPNNAYYAVLYFAWDTVTTYYVDMFYVGLTPYVEYEEARAVTISLAPKLENYIENPSFEVDDSLWTETNLAFSQSSNVPLAGYPGDYSGQFYCMTGSWSLQCDSQLELESGIYFNVSQYMYSPDMSSVDAYIDLYDIDDNLLDTIQNTLDLTSTNSGDWIRDYTSVLIPSTSLARYAKYRLEGTAGTLFLDMVMAQDTTKPTDYFDGSMPELTGVIWEGTAHQSYSLYYPNKAIKFPRLVETLKDWLPMNTFWRVVTPAGLEYTNLTV